MYNLSLLVKVYLSANRGTRKGKYLIVMQTCFLSDCVLSFVFCNKYFKLMTSF